MKNFIKKALESISLPIRINANRLDRKAYARLHKECFILNRRLELLKDELDFNKKVLDETISLCLTMRNDAVKLQSQYEQSQSWQVVNSEAVDYGKTIGTINAVSEIQLHIQGKTFKINDIKLDTKGLL